MGMYSSILTLVTVIGLELSMIFKNDFGSYLSSMFIAWGFVPMICSFASYSKNETKSASYITIALSTVYSVFIMITYYAQLTTVRLSLLSREVSHILDYKKFGLLFNYNLLGYSVMALATFFIALTIRVDTKADKWLKLLLVVHGFFATCAVIPILGVFNSNLVGGDMIGVLVLEFWCAYFTPACILSYIHFAKK